MQDQDVFVVASCMLILATTLVIGNLIADITLALLDPRVRLS
jgi:peptide/nickel transport system permease protein